MSDLTDSQKRLSANITYLLSLQNKYSRLSKKILRAREKAKKVVDINLIDNCKLLIEKQIRDIDDFISLNQSLLKSNISEQEVISRISLETRKLDERKKEIDNILSKLKRNPLFRKILSGILLGFMLSFLSPKQTTSDSEPPKIEFVKEEPKLRVLDTKIGAATYYTGKLFEGKPTKSGEIYSSIKLTCALPKRSKWAPEHKGKFYFVKVTNLENGRSIILSATDTGNFGLQKNGKRNKYPYVKLNYSDNTSEILEKVVDLSPVAYRELGGTGTRPFKAKLEILDKEV